MPEHLGTIDAGETAVYSGVVTNGVGAPLPASSLDSLTLTLTDAATGAVVNARDAQNALNANGVTVGAAGELVWTMTPQDTALLAASPAPDATELRVAVFRWTWDAGAGVGSHRITFRVRNVSSAVDADAGLGPATGFVSRAEIRDRLSAVGYRWAADRSGDGAVGEAEAAAVFDPAIAYANNLIASAIAGLVDDPTAPEVAAVAWLRDRGLDIAAYRSTTQGGKKVPGVLKADFDRALEMLAEVRRGELAVPGIATTGPQASPSGVKAIQLHDGRPDRFDRHDRRRGRRWDY